MKYLQDEKKLNAAAFILFLIPGTPKDLFTYLAGLTKIRLLPWIVLTSIARIPSIITSTISGNALGIEKYSFAIILYAATAIVSGIGIFFYQRAQRKHMLSEAAQELIRVPLAEYPPPIDPDAPAQEAKPADESAQDTLASKP